VARERKAWLWAPDELAALDVAAEELPAWPPGDALLDELVAPDELAVARAGPLG